MRTECAHCGRKIEWWRPLRSVAIPTPGHRLARSAVKCPFCEGVLVTNPHPSEDAALITAEICAVPVLIAVFGGIRSIGLIVVAAVGLLVCAAVALYVNVRLREWPRYARSTPAEG